MKKLIFLSVFLLFLLGCGASTDEAVADPGERAMLFDSAVTGSASLAPGSGKTATADTKTRYFLFDRKTNQMINEDGVELVYEQYCDTTYHSTDSAEGEWVRSVLGDIQQAYQADSESLAGYAEELMPFYTDSEFYSYSNYQELGIARHDSRVVSLISLSSMYSGGAHAYAEQTAYNLDLQELRLLALEDVISEERAPELSGMVLDAIREKFAMLEDYGLYEDYESTIDQSFVYGGMTKDWYLNDVGLVIYYDPYELAPYAAGVIKVELPYGDLRGILREAYYPAESGGMTGDLAVQESVGDAGLIPITIDPSGERILIGAEGEICQIQLSEIFWLEDQPVMQQMLFSSDSLAEEDVLEIIGGFDDSERSFAIEFTDGTGETTVYYVHPDGLSEQP